MIGLQNTTVKKDNSKYFYISRIFPQYLYCPQLWIAFSNSVRTEWSFCWALSKVCSFTSGTTPPFLLPHLCPSRQRPLSVPQVRGMWQIISTGIWRYVQFPTSHPTSVAADAINNRLLVNLGRIRIYQTPPGSLTLTFCISPEQNIMADAASHFDTLILTFASFSRLVVALRRYCNCVDPASEVLQLPYNSLAPSTTKLIMPVPRLGPLLVLIVNQPYHLRFDTEKCYWDRKFKQESPPSSQRSHSPNPFSNYPRDHE